MSYSTRGIPGQSNDLRPSDQHEKTVVHVFSIDGTVLDVLQRTVFIDGAGRRVVSFFGGRRLLRTKKGHDAIVLNLQDADRYMTTKNKKRIRVSELKSLLRRVLNEEAPILPDPTQPKEETEDSVDSQIDRYLGQYEGEAKSVKTEGLCFRSMTRRFLTEAEDGEEEPAEDAEEPVDEPAPEEPPKLSLDEIDVESFANDVARLIESADSLLEFRSTIARRAKNFLMKTYDQQVLQAFEASLRDEHGIVPGESKEEFADTEFPAPGADRAGDGGSGAGGAPA